MENATDVQISSIGAGVGPSGAQEIRPELTTTYTLTATNKFGQVSATVTVTVTVRLCRRNRRAQDSGADRLLRFAFDIAEARRPGHAHMTVANATAVSIAGLGTVPLNGPTVVKPLTDTVSCPDRSRQR